MNGRLRYRSRTSCASITVHATAALQSCSYQALARDIILGLPAETDRHVSLQEDGVPVHHLSLVISSSRQGQAPARYQTDMSFHLCRCQSTCCFEYKRIVAAGCLRSFWSASSRSCFRLWEVILDRSGSTPTSIGSASVTIKNKPPLLDSLFTLRHVDTLFLTSLSSCLGLSPQRCIANRNPCQRGLNAYRDVAEQRRSTCYRQFRSHRPTISSVCPSLAHPD